MEAKTMKHLFLYGAIDRFNYGDLLLPVLLKEKFKELQAETSWNIRVFGTVESDLSHFGALPTESLGAFYEAMQSLPAAVLLVGGEVLSPSWATVYSHLHLPANIWHDATVRLKRLNNLISKWLLGGHDKRPFILNPARFPLTKGIVYNGVGGKRRGKYKRLDLKYLQSASYLSCRDEAVWKVLQKNLPASELVPDSAIQMAELFPKERLDTLVCPAVQGQFKADYIFFQISLSVAGEIGMDALAEKLRSTSGQYGKKIILCPIGTALGHDDQLALSQLKSRLPEESFVLIENPGLWDIMGLIAHASIYIGGSLHGIITSMSFDVPYLFLRNRPKLVEYVNTWGVQELKGATTLENWDVRIQTAFSLEKQVLMDSRNKQMEISERSFRKMVEILDRA
jgi:hypothetical protein